MSAYRIPSCRVRSVQWLFALGLSLVSCDQTPGLSTNTAPVDANRAPQTASTQDLKQRQIAFLNRIREADPQHRTIDRALLNEQNDLGLVLDRSVEMEKIPALMRTMLTQMAGEFPNQDLTVVAYAPSDPPRKIGTAHFNARTRDMSYTRD
ncbi:MAG: hypothetical protein ABJB09_06945 [Verrucomicrobiota bacterium]